MTVTPVSATAEPAPERQARFAAAVAALRTRAGAASVDRWFRLAGPVLLPLGALVILLGWYGAANTTRVFLQIPYLISGGLFGVGLMFTGGFLYFARWMTDLVEETRQQADRAAATAEQTARSLAAIEQLLRERPLHTAPPRTAVAAPPRVRPELVATSKGSLVHRPDCRMVAGRDVAHLDEPGDRQPCRVCLGDG